MDEKPRTFSDQLPLRRALFVLTVVTGLIDAVSFLGLGHVFTANMTGNVAFLGFAMGGVQGVSAVRSLTALCAFAFGGLLGGLATNGRERAPAGHLLIAMYSEGVLLCLAAGSTLFGQGELSSAGAYVVIVSTAVAMGLRNAVVRKLAVPDLTTTVLTLTVTGLAADSMLAGGAGGRSTRQVLSILAMLGGALVGALLWREAGISLPLTAAALLVVGCSVYLPGLFLERRDRFNRELPTWPNRRSSRSTLADPLGDVARRRARLAISRLTTFLDFVVRHGEVFIFMYVFADQIGIPARDRMRRRAPGWRWLSSGRA